jgi:NADPH:quinone reductase-like Zn-dependent oxidoreductase
MMAYQALLLSNIPAFSADIVTLDIRDKSAIARTWPMVAGIDAAGGVERSPHPGFQPGDAVVLNDVNR